MTNRNRVVNEFVELVKIDSLSLQERHMADILTTKLTELGLDVNEDDAGQKLGGNCGNIIAVLKGDNAIPAIMLSAHMDTVTPGIGKKPVIEGNIIKTDGTTVLGGDDAAGIESILEAIRLVKERDYKHGDIQVVFTIGEETGLLGAKNLDYSRIYAKYCFVMDGGGDIGTVAISAPSQYHIEVSVKGKAAHAGAEPEKGISAVQIAADAISAMKLGRIDEETTANIGIINGGRATNIICDLVELKAEARSRNESKLENQVAHMKQCFLSAAEKFGGKVEFKTEFMYPAYNIAENEQIISILRKAANDAGTKLILEATGGGSDTNIINGKGIRAADVSVGMSKVHSVEEEININDLLKAAEFIAAIIRNVEQV